MTHPHAPTPFTEGVAPLTRGNAQQQNIWLRQPFTRFYSGQKTVGVPKNILNPPNEEAAESNPVKMDSPDSRCLPNPGGYGQEAIEFLEDLLAQSTPGSPEAFNMERIVRQVKELRYRLLEVQLVLIGTSRKAAQAELTLKELKDRNKEEANYELQELGKGTFVYQYKHLPYHCICPFCFVRGKKIILQSFDGGMRCAGCNTGYAFER